MLDPVGLRLLGALYYRVALRLHLLHDLHDMKNLLLDDLCHVGDDRGGLRADEHEHVGEALRVDAKEGRGPVRPVVHQVQAVAPNQVEVAERTPAQADHLLGGTIQIWMIHRCMREAHVQASKPVA